MSVTSLVSAFGYRNANHTWPEIEDEYDQLDYICSFCLETAANGSSLRGYSTVAPFKRNFTLTTTVSPEEEGNLEDALAARVNITESNSTLCIISRSIDKNLFYRSMLIPAAIFITILSCLLKRRRLALNCCSGRPGLVFPVNLIELQRHRFSYVASFTFISWVMLDILLAPFLGDKESGGLPFYPNEMDVMWNAKSFMLLVACLQYAVVFYPVFASITSEHVLGYVLGTIYIWTLALVFVLDKCICHDDFPEDNALAIASNAPPLICLAYLTVSLPLRLVGTCCAYCSSKKSEKIDFGAHKVASSSEILHVKELLRKRTPLKPKWHERIYKPTPSFKYSVSILTGATMAICFVFMACILILRKLYDYLEDFKDVIRKAWEAAKTGRDVVKNPVILFLAGYLNMDPQDIKAAYIWEGLRWWQRLEACIYSSMSLAFISVVLSMLFSLRNYKANMLLIYRGQQYEIPRASDYSPYSLLLAAARYIGYQAAYATGGFVLQFAVLTLALIAIVTFLVLVIEYEMVVLLKLLVERIWVAVVVMVSLLVIQMLLARLLFTLKNDKNENVLALDNRRFFFNFHYFAVFANTAIGFVSCIVRILKSVVFGLWTIPRLDMSTLNRHFERFDPGFVSYVGLLYLENAHRNPTMLVAVKIFLETLENRSSPRVFTITEGGRKLTPASRYQVVKNRWQLLYSLHNNPILRFFRKHNVQKLETVKTNLVYHA